jgi:hypothetical protein
MNSGAQIFQVKHLVESTNATRSQLPKLILEIANSPFQVGGAEGSR